MARSVQSRRGAAERNYRRLQVDGPGRGNVWLRDVDRSVRTPVNVTSERVASNTMTQQLPTLLVSGSQPFGTWLRGFNQMHVQQKTE
ncbi:hypothetical protein F2P81_026380 [Scophthalmus maximus]|uniref:Uncharacterized protein n=1 Tax=Scophthalmus maximus TaxID=52904 RepID=A0A6A4RMI7_SCOMX|nr:hypothetical protein F2P81_026380 [Scophthalmus maximus]